jgi:uncharacterized protein YjiK
MTPEEAHSAWGIYYIGGNEFVVTEEQHRKLASGKWVVDYNVATGEWKLVEANSARNSS